MREAVINAVIHRDYASPTTIQIRVYDDRIAIWNAVQLPTEWAADQLAGELSSKPYNPRIAYAFFRAGMIEAWGRGIRRIVEMCREAGNPAPEWKLESSGDGLWLRFPFSASYLAADSAGSSDTTQKTTRKAEVSGVEAGEQPESQPESQPDWGRAKVPVEVPVQAKTREGTREETEETRENTREITREITRENTGENTREKILNLIAGDPSITTSELAKRLGITRKGIEWQIGKLKRMGVLVRIGPARGGHWKLVEMVDE